MPPHDISQRSFLVKLATRHHDPLRKSDGRYLIHQSAEEPGNGNYYAGGQRRLDFEPQCGIKQLATSQDTIRLIHSENLYSAPPRNPLRSAPNPATTEEKRLGRLIKHSLCQLLYIYIHRYT